MESSSFCGAVNILFYPVAEQQNLFDYYSLYRITTEKQIHARSAHYQNTGSHACIYCPLDPLLSIGNTDQREANRALDSDQSETPGLLKDVKPHVRVGDLISTQRSTWSAHTRPRQCNCSNRADCPERLRFFISLEFSLDPQISSQY